MDYLAVTVLWEATSEKASRSATPTLDALLVPFLWDSTRNSQRASLYIVLYLHTFNVTTDL